MAADIYYGKHNVTVYRTYATPLREVPPIPESAFTGRENTLFAVDVDVRVFGDSFLPAYTEGDNRQVVATDTMKNVILGESLTYEGATLEGLLYALGRHFLTTYPQMGSLRMTGHEEPFAAPLVPQEGGGFAPSAVLFRRERGDRAMATLHLERDGDGVRITEHQCGYVQVQLIKVTGSAFANFMRDDYTTLPERRDRPLYIHMDAFWRYTDPTSLATGGAQGYVPAEQVRDVIQATFHEFVSMSIQHLIYEMGARLLARFPQLSEVSFDAQNRLWDTAFAADDNERVKTYCDPRPPYGNLGLTLRRDDLDARKAGA